ncbi:hypothetical protein ACFXPI_05625 [Streptomyces sp. NPDC059104]|uniref:hypothetical protein n=1 Tax=Streptomyces sp. NPDC059104 TaxID=3346729 RepID=UPI0036C14EDE
MSWLRELTEGFVHAMTSPRRVTWPRLYGNLLRSDGVDVADPRAVRDWFAGFTARPYAERRSVLGFATPAGDEPLGQAAYAEVLCAERSSQARLLLAGRVETVALAERVRPQPGESPLIRDAPTGEPDGEREDWYDEQTGILAYRWTAAGLDALLHGPYAHLAPGGCAFAPLLAFVEDMAVAPGDVSRRRRPTAPGPAACLSRGADRPTACHDAAPAP